ncbi:MAG: HAMP domain-containing sensor histidine kinase [Kofleriaceae bacterium]
MSNLLADRLRSRKQSICEAWQSRVVAEVPELGNLDNAALIDHLPELIDALAAWSEGDTRTARLGFTALADGHAIQRLGYGVDLRTLTREYALVRSVVLRELVDLSQEEHGDLFLRIVEGLDEALYDSVRRYAERRDQARDYFIAVLAHDLRSPLNAIMVASGVLELSRNPVDIAEAGRVITAGATRLKMLSKDLLELARDQFSGGIPLQLVPTDIGDVFRAAIEELRAVHAGRPIHLDVKGDVTGIFDHGRLFQVASNLIANAVEHGGDPIEISISESQDRRAIVTSVTNHGGGLSTSELQALFDPMRPARASAKGLGLGARIVGSIALAHGAVVTTSSGEHNVTITITWPRARNDELSTDARRG